ncbi:MAG TPA: DNA primase [Anaerolineae bacterium]|nr:DNA primase [Anaerolineae bacterium]
MSVVDEIKERLDIVDVISGYVPLKKAGRNFKGLCPFHAEKTPSFIVFPDTQSWHCFGACGTGGDVFSFIMKRENLEFGEALQLLAKRAGVELAPRGPAETAAEKRKDRLREINAAAAQYFHNLLLQSSEGTRAREYLARREIAPETINAFQLGYALNVWEALKGHLVGRGYEVADILAAGLIVEREGGGYYDRFRGRLIFPIRDMHGQVIGFGGRVLDDSLPKYLNSPQTPLFNKSSVLYGIDLAKGAIRRENRAVIVEGYMDVLMAHQHGIANVVASMGTALTEAQLRLLKRLTKKFTLALDADAAGDQATLRGLALARETLDRQIVPVPTPRGLISYEGRLDAEIRIITLPEGKDPDEVIRENPDRWNELVQAALPVVDYYFEAFTSDLDLTSAKGKSEAVRRLLPIIREITDGTEQTHYVQKLSRLVREDERKLQARLKGTGWRNSAKSKRLAEIAPRKKRGPLSSLPGLPEAEKYCLLLFLKEPHLILEAETLLQELELGSLSPDDFDQVENREIFIAWREYLINRENGFDLEEFQSALDTPLQTYLSKLLAEHIPSEGEAAKDIGRSVLKLRERKLRAQNEMLPFLQSEAEEQGDWEALRRYIQMVDDNANKLGRIQHALKARTLFGRRETARDTLL